MGISRFDRIFVDLRSVMFSQVCASPESVGKRECESHAARETRTPRNAIP